MDEQRLLRAASYDELGRFLQNQDEAPYGLTQLDFPVLNSTTKEEEVWTLVWRAGRAVGLVHGQKFFVRGGDYSRNLFFRLLDERGFQERVEFVISTPEVTGDVRQNVSAWYFDDWKLENFFSLYKSPAPNGLL